MSSRDRILARTDVCSVALEGVTMGLVKLYRRARWIDQELTRLSAAAPSDARLEALRVSAAHVRGVLDAAVASVGISLTIVAGASPDKEPS